MFTCFSPVVLDKQHKDIYFFRECLETVCVSVWEWGGSYPLDLFCKSCVCYCYSYDQKLQTNTETYIQTSCCGWVWTAALAYSYPVHRIHVWPIAKVKQNTQWNMCNRCMTVRWRKEVSLLWVTDFALNICGWIIPAPAPSIRLIFPGGCC